jgi:hypothetical protein
MQDKGDDAVDWNVNTVLHALLMEGRVPPVRIGTAYLKQPLDLRNAVLAKDVLDISVRFLRRNLEGHRGFVCRPFIGIRPGFIVGIQSRSVGLAPTIVRARNRHLDCRIKTRTSVLRQRILVTNRVGDLLK